MSRMSIESGTRISKPTPEALYEKLPAGQRPRGGLSPDEVAADQRRRLRGAMIEAVARHGYTATTVGEVVGLAGVSRKTLYKHYAGKQECFLATYDFVVRESVERISAAYRGEMDGTNGGRGGSGERDWTDGLCRALDAFVAEIVMRPQAAWLALVEVLAVGPAALGRVERGEAVFESMIAQSFAQAPDGTKLPPVFVRGIVHGLWYVARKRLLEGRPAAMSDSSRELLRWLLAYRSPAVGLLERASMQGGESRSGAGGGGAASRIEGDERTRLLRAAARIAAADGYGSLSGGRIAELAGVEQERFFELFGDVEECFLACFELRSAQALACALQGAREAPDWPAAMCGAIEALLSHAAHDPVFARVVFVEIFAVGPAGVRRRAAVMHGFAEVLARRVPRSLRPGPLVTQAIAGAVWGTVHHEVVHGRARSLQSLSAQVSCIVLAPLLGAQRAVEAILGHEGGGDPGRLSETA